MVEYKKVVGVRVAALLFKPEAVVITGRLEVVLALHADFLVLTGIVELENGAVVAMPAAVEVLALHALFFVLETTAPEDMAGEGASVSRGADDVTTPAAVEVISALVAGRLVAIVTLSAEVALKISDEDEPGAAVETGTGITVAVETEIGAAEITVPEPDPPQVATGPPGAV